MSYNPTDTSITQTNTFEAVAKYGINPNTIRFLTYNHFHFPANYIDTLDTYYILKWETSYFLSHMINGTVESKETIYQVIYHKTDPTKLKRRKDFTTVKLSFRIPDAVFNIPPTVLVQEVKDKGETSE